MGSLLDQLKAALGAGQTTGGGDPQKSKSADISAQDIADGMANGESAEQVRERLRKQQHSDHNN